MIDVGDLRLSPSAQPVIMRARVAFAALLLCTAAPVLAQQAPSPSRDSVRDDLDVTMQIIVDPDAKLPDEVARRIPLPARRSNQSTSPAAADDSDKRKENEKDERPAAGTEQRAREGQQIGRDLSERARERSQEAAEQREQARRSVVEERRRNPGPPRDPPGRPESPPRD